MTCTQSSLLRGSPGDCVLDYQGIYLTYSLWLFGSDVMPLWPISLSEINFLIMTSMLLVQTEGRITLLNRKGKSFVNLERSTVTLFYLNIIFNATYFER